VLCMESINALSVRGWTEKRVVETVCRELGLSKTRLGELRRLYMVRCSLRFACTRMDV
jgi:hypothetical protein